jgi:hypothetical protein
MASLRRKRLLTLAALVFVGALGWFWPARRNYYFRRDLVVRHLDLAYSAANDPKRQLDLYLPPDPRPPGAPGDPRILLRNGVAPEAISGFVSIDGIFDLAASLPAFKPAQAEIVRELFGPGDADLAAHSPISYARAKHPPLLFVDSTGDQPVCLDGFHSMKARMTEMGSSAGFVELAGLGHNEAVLRIGTDADPVMPSLLAFVR